MVIILMHFKDTLGTAVPIAELIAELTPVVKKPSNSPRKCPHPSAAS